MKERVTLTLDHNLLKQVDSRVDGYTIKNRSHAIELYLMQALGGHTPKKALILAGGKGTRLKPITHEIPKPLIPVHGKPLIQHTIELLKKYNIKEIIISVGYMKEKIKQALGDGHHLGVNITYVEEQTPLGTAGPLALAKPLLKETFVMSNADELKEIDLADMYRFHKESGSKATIALTTVADPGKYGVVRLNGNKIVEFVEKPKGAPPSNLINSGLYILEPEVIDYVPKGFAMVEKDVFPKIAKEGKLFGYSFSGQWYDTNTLESYEHALKSWKDIKP